MCSHHLLSFGRYVRGCIHVIGEGVYMDSQVTCCRFASMAASRRLRRSVCTLPGPEPAADSISSMDTYRYNYRTII